jgi:hypothetical protein
MKEIVLIGYYQQNESLSRFIGSVQHEFNIPVRYVNSGVTGICRYTFLVGMQISINLATSLKEAFL